MRGCSLVVKPQFSKLMMRVRFPSSPPLKSVLVSAETETLFFFAPVPAVDQMLCGPELGPQRELLTQAGARIWFSAKCLYGCSAPSTNSKLLVDGRLVEICLFRIDCFCTNRGVAQLG
jgi:hypothetical protein